MKNITFLMFLILVVPLSKVEGQTIPDLESIGIEHVRADSTLKNFQYLELISDYWKLDSIGRLGYRWIVARRMHYRIKSTPSCKIRYNDIVGYLGKPYIEETKKRYTIIKYICHTWDDDIDYGSSPHIVFTFKRKKLVKVKYNGIE